MCRWMDVLRWMGGWEDEWMGVECVYVYMCGWVDGWMYDMDGWMDGWMDRWVSERVDG